MGERYDFEHFRGVYGWIGVFEMNIPHGWSKKTLEDLVELDVEKLSELTPADFLFHYLDISSASQGRLTIPSLTTSFIEAPSRARKIVRCNDVLMSMVRPNLKAFALFNDDRRTCVASTGFAVLRSKKETSASFVLYSILSEDVTNQIDALVTGSSYPAINSTTVRSLKILTPPKEEQTKIAEVLAMVDQAIEQTEALIAKQQRTKTGLMQDLLTRGIDEHGQLRTEQTHAFKDSPLGRIPMEWNVVPFSHFVEKLESGVSVNSDDQPCGAGQVGVLKTSAMYGGKFFPDQNKTVIHEDLQRVRVSPRKNTILISRMNTPNLVGESGFVDEDHPNLYLPDRIWMTKFLADKTFASKWMSFVLTSKSVRAFISLNATGTSGSMKNLPQKSLMGMLIASPTSESEIRQITKALIQSEVSTNSDVEHLRKLKLIKNALMQDLLTGRKRVTDLLEPVAS